MKSERIIRAYRDDLIAIFSKDMSDLDTLLHLVWEAEKQTLSRVIGALSWALGEIADDAPTEYAAKMARQ